MIAGSEGLINVLYEEVYRVTIPVVGFDPFTAPEASPWRIGDIDEAVPGELIAVEEPGISLSFSQLAFAIPHVVLGVRPEVVDLMDYQGRILSLDRTFERDDMGELGSVIFSGERVVLSAMSRERADGILHVLGSRDQMPEPAETPLTLGLRAIATYFASSKDRRLMMIDESYRAEHPDWEQKLDELAS